MPYRKTTFFAGFVIVIALGAFALHYFQGITGTNSPETIGDQIGRADFLESQTPSHVLVRMDPPAPTFHAGDTGSFTIIIEIDTATTIDGTRSSWNRDLKAPAAAWLSVTRESGIVFTDRRSIDGGGHETQLTFESPDPANPSVMAKRVSYAVDSRVQAKKYNVSLEVVADLVTDNGLQVQDIGTVKIPVSVDTQLATKFLMLLTVGLAILLFVVEWVRIDVVAMVMMVLLPELGLLKAGDAFRGLSSNAVIAIIGVMIISFGLNRTGLVNRLVQPILKYVRKGESRLVIVFSSLIAAISGVMQNTGAAVLFLPAIRLVTTRELKIHISRVLMPIGMAAILGGTLTMIGTSPLILLNDILPAGMPKFGFLELTPIGLAITVGGIIYLSTIGMRLLAKRKVDSSRAGGQDGVISPLGIDSNYPEIIGPVEVFIPDDYKPNGEPQEIAEIRRRFLVNTVAMSTRDGSLNIAPHPKRTLKAGRSMCLYGLRKNIEKFVKTYRLVLRDKPVHFKRTLFDPSYAGVAEMIIAPRSQFVGKCIQEIRFRQTYGLNALALHQDGALYYRELADRSLNPGDAVLVHGTWEQIQKLKEQHHNFIIVTSSKKDIHKPEKARYALISVLVSFVLMLLSSFYFQGMAYNPIPLSICLMVGALGMVISKVMTISEAYRSIDTRTVFLLGGLIPLGMAVDQTGTAQWLAKGIILGLGSFMSPLVLLIVLAVLSCAFTMVVSNVGACALLVPLGVSLASQLGIDPRVAAIVVGIGVSNSFILPTHQVNALYMGPGEYQTKDYLKVGSGLSVVYMAILVAVAYLLYL